MPKRYNISPVKEEFDWGEMMVIKLGERGRGRKFTLIPYHAPEDAELIEIGTTRSNNPKIVPSKNRDGWIAVVSGSGVYTRNTYGSVYCLEKDIDKIKVIAHGVGAYGMAGKIGNWNDFLVYVPDNTFLKVCPAGGAHKVPRYWLYFAEDKVYHIEKEEMDLFCEQKGIDIPPDEPDSLVDLILFTDMSPEEIKEYIMQQQKK